MLYTNKPNWGGISLMVQSENPDGANPLFEAPAKKKKRILRCAHGLRAVVHWWVPSGKLT